MKTKLLALAFVLVAVPSFAQWDPNMVFSAGASGAVEKPLVGNRVQVSFAATLPGLRLSDNLFGGSLYAINPGVNIHTVDVGRGTATGLGLTLGGLEFHPKGGKFAILAGVTRDVTGDAKTTAVFVHVGGSLSSPAALARKRAAKKAGKPLPTCE